MHHSPLHAILIHRRGFRTSHRRCRALQRVAGPYLLHKSVDMVRDGSLLTGRKSTNREGKSSFTPTKKAGWVAE